MRKLKYILILLLLFFNWSAAFSQQQKAFSNDPEKFLKEMGSFFAKTAQKKELKELMDQFTLVWTEGTLSEDQKNRIYATSNKLLKKRAMAYPHFKNYLLAIMAFEKNMDAMEVYEDWGGFIGSTIVTIE